MWLEYSRCFLQRLDDIDRLVFVRQCSFKISGNDGSPFCMATFTYFNGLIAVLYHLIDPILLACSERSFPMPVIRCDHKNTHVHPQFCKEITDLFLLINRALHHIVVFDCPKAIIKCKFYLVKEITARIVLKHTVMRRIIALEFTFIGSRILFVLCRQNGWNDDTSSCKNCILNKIFAIHS